MKSLKYLVFILVISFISLSNDYDEETGLYKTPYKLYPLSGNSSVKPVCDVSGYRADAGGRMFLLNDPPHNANENGPILCIDINGEKLPNRYGKDFFLFLFRCFYNKYNRRLVYCYYYDSIF